jgi:hypothetical protein
MKSAAERTDEARRLIERLVKISPDAGITARAEKMLNRVKLPMSVVIDKIPGDTIIGKAAQVGVSRQTIYYWLHGLTRPGRKHAKLLASLTGFDANEIAGRAA